MTTPDLTTILKLLEEKPDRQIVRNVGDDTYRMTEANGDAVTSISEDGKGVPVVTTDEQMVALERQGYVVHDGSLTYILKPPAEPVTLKL